MLHWQKLQIKARVNILKSNKIVADESRVSIKCHTSGWWKRKSDNSWVMVELACNHDNITLLTFDNWEPSCKMFMSSKNKFEEAVFCSYLQNDDPFKPRSYTCHNSIHDIDSCAVMGHDSTAIYGMYEIVAQMDH